ncbi:hypothetical protein TSAR_015633 [Trichomalopsis sarcophagae]|uniref:Uncharacterized protein n=1 Tax=Trichomalopsis sarcophagae TaxID=543379 RepID=A0A232EG60_9HYME|nr:hypothetical protein TSAR_015633 [Trichomalopsis sarcophagae]
MEYFASLRCFDDFIKYYYMPVSSIYFNKNDDHPIKPNDLDDFDKKHKYYVLWSDNIKYQCHIVCLGVVRSTGVNKHLSHNVV